LNLLVPSKANASSAFQQYSAQWSTNALGLLARLRRSASRCAFAFT